MKRIGFKVTAIASVFVAFGFAACKNEKKSGGTEKIVHIGYYTGDICNAPMHVAMKNGYFQEEFDKIGQKFDFISRIQANGASVGELVSSGKMDAGTDIAAADLPQMENGLGITFTTGYHTGCTKFYVRADSPINSPADLDGKKVAIPGLADSALMNMKRKLGDLGIATDEQNGTVKFLVYNTPDMPVALQNGAVDAIGLHDPVASIAEAQYGFKKIFDIGDDPKFENEFCCQAFVSQKLARENPEGAAAFTRAIMRASAYVEANPRETAKMQLENNFVTGELEQNTKILDDLNFNPSVSRGQKTVDAQARDLQKFGFLSKSTDIEKFISESFTVLDGVPESYVYENGEIKAIN